MSSTTTDKVFDALIIGGSFSGLAAALTMARQQHSAIVLDSEVYRNEASAQVYNVVTWDQGSPAALRAAAKKNILDYYSTIEFERACISRIEEVEDGGSSHQTFSATNDGGKVWRGRKVILATGVRDVFPEIEGYAECWAKGM